MYWVSKRLSNDEGQHQNHYPHCIEIIRLVLVIAVLCSSSLAFAGTFTDATEMISEPDAFNVLGDDAAMMNDTDLSLINGKGAEASALEGDSKLAIILWDEGRQGNKGSTNHAMSSPPVITLTVIQK